MSHLPTSLQRLITRHGSAVTVRRTTGTLNPVTSIRTPTTTDVVTVGVFRKRVQQNTQANALATEQLFYLVPSPPFTGIFIPMDADLVIAGAKTSRVTSVRTRERRGLAIAYELYVSGAS